MLRRPTGPLSARWSEFLSSLLYDLAPLGYDAGRGPNGQLAVRVLAAKPLRVTDFPRCANQGTSVTVTKAHAIDHMYQIDCRNEWRDRRR
jgi:hypothetical protein